MMVRITSLEHMDRFDSLDDGMLREVARMIRRLVSWLEMIHPGRSYNLLLHTRTACHRQDHDSFHWSIDIFPRLSRNRRV